MTTVLVPWVCHICGRRFDSTHGGICSRCGEVTCSTCFESRSSPRKKQVLAEGGRCRLCAGTENTERNPQQSVK